jgi:DNA-binding response OmpR family regulator
LRYLVKPFTELELLNAVGAVTGRAV